MHFVAIAALLGGLGGLAIRDARRESNGRGIPPPAGSGPAATATATASATASASVVVTVRTSEVEELRAGFRATQKREPTPAELGDLLEGFVSEEILYREGMARGLDRDDRVVRRRVIDRMTELARPRIPDHEPTEAELAFWFSRYRHRFVRPATVSIEQIFFDSKRHPDARAAAARALAVIHRGGDRGGQKAAQKAAGSAPSSGQLGDATLLPRALADSTALELSHLFGSDFAAQAMAAPIGEWQGPVSSSHGAHLVRVLARHPERMPTFAEAERHVRADWLTVERRGTRAAAESLLPHYRILLPPDLASAAIPLFGKP
jgi:hypothetical protein